MVILALNQSDLYGQDAATTLQFFYEAALRTSDRFAEQFYDALLQQHDLRVILKRLDPKDFEHLLTQQKRHLAMLISPGLGEDSHRQRAINVGRIHALVGVDIMWLTEAYGLYQQKLHELLNSKDLIGHHATQKAVRLIDRRLLTDLQHQSAGYRGVDQGISKVAAEVQQRALMARSVVDLYQEALRALCTIDGVIAAFVSRMGVQRLLEVETYEGPSAQAYLTAMHEGDIPQICVPEADAEEVDGPSASAWRTGQVQTTGAYTLDDTVKPWSPVGKRLGFRSSAAIPLVDETGQTFAEINLYSKWPGFFEAAGRHAFLEQIQQIVSITASRHAQGQTVPYALRKTYKNWVAERRVRMLYQPIVDLNTGELIKVEGLARLIADDGSLVSPAEFLPTLGSGSLLKLFEIGVEQACKDHRAWRDQGIDVGVSLNLPTLAVNDARYHDALFSTLENCGIDTEAISIEILESAGDLEGSARAPFFETLRALGIRIVQDDLGAGHSSLLRLDSMPFDEVKIDQGLVLTAARKDPERAFTFILYLTQLSHALRVMVTVEGLEDAGLIEAAAVLGADHGQGYGIARPMPSEDLARWRAAYRHDIDVQNPKTAWGALAGYLLWDRQLQALDRWPDLIQDFVNVPCLVEKFIDRLRLHDSLLERLLKENHALAMQSRSKGQYLRSRRDVIAALGMMGSHS